MSKSRRVVAGWSSQDARDHFEERSAIIQYSCGCSEEKAEAAALAQMLKMACSWCGEPHAGGPEYCEK